MTTLSSLLSVEDDLENNFDKWMYILQQLPYLQIQPRELHHPVFQKLFEAPEIANLTPNEYNIGIARQMKMGDEPIENIFQFTGRAKEEIEKL